MRIKVADYIADRLVGAGIRHVFTVTGGGAMHLNDGLGHKEGLTCIYDHHEQACAMAAESYARIHRRIAAVCVTTGPGGTNAITGVLGGWLDSIPMLVLSGQVRYDTTARWSGVGIRAMGEVVINLVWKHLLRGPRAGKMHCTSTTMASQAPVSTTFSWVRKLPAMGMP